jgi:hypothetical protein
MHDIALIGGDGPRFHHFAFYTLVRTRILNICDNLGGRWRRSRIEPQGWAATFVSVGAEGFKLIRDNAGSR